MSKADRPCRCGFDPSKAYRCPKHSPERFVFKEDVLSDSDWVKWLKKFKTKDWK